MTITIDPMYVYICLTLILVGIQIYHSNRIKKIEREVDDLWDQIKILVQTTAAAFEKFENKIDNATKESKK